MGAIEVDREGRLGWFGYLDWGAILASVFAGLGTTLLLVAFGSAAGIEAADDGGDETRISSIVGTWTVVSALIGTFVGTFIGGRFSRFQSGASAVYNALTSWGVRSGARAVVGRQRNRGLARRRPSFHGRRRGQCLRRRRGAGGRRRVVGRLGACAWDGVDARGRDRRVVDWFALATRRCRDRRCERSSEALNNTAVGVGRFAGRKGSRSTLCILTTVATALVAMATVATAAAEARLIAPRYTAC